MNCMYCNGTGRIHKQICPICGGTKRFTHDDVAEENERYTPPYYINLAKKVMGGIDLDVASCEMANQNVEAPHFYSRKESGLTHNWYGRIWCNPPYGSTEHGNNSVATFQRLFIEKALAEYEAGHFSQGILLLLGNVIYTTYFPPLFYHTLCLNKHTLWFSDPLGRRIHSGWGNVFVYMGDNVQSFVEVFRTIGTVLTGATVYEREREGKAKSV